MIADIFVSWPDCFSVPSLDLEKNHDKQPANGQNHSVA